MEFLRAENAVLRKHRPNSRVFLAPQEKARLVKLARAVGAELKQLITIVRYETFQRWAHNVDAGRKPKKMGRPTTSEEARELILRLARETGWGYTRILGELKKLGVKPPSKTTVKNILRAAGYEPGPSRGDGSWDDFLNRHAQTLCQCDFFSKRVVTRLGLRQVFALAFLHVGTRRVWVSPSTFKPDAAWVKEQAAAFITHARAENLEVGLVMRDNDSKYENGFDGVLSAAGVNVRKTAFRAPNENAFIERWVQSVKRECLDWFIAFGLRHFDFLVREYVEHYHGERTHQAMENCLLMGETPPDRSSGEINCRERLGGVLKHYYRGAA